MNEIPPLVARATTTAPLPCARPRELNWTDLIIAVAILWALDVGIVIAMVVILPVRQGVLGLASQPLITPPMLIVSVSCLSLLCSTVVIWLFAARKYGRTFIDAFALGRVSFAITSLSIAVGIVCGIGGCALASRFSTGNSMMARMVSQPGGFAAMTILALIAPVAEELYYRGFILPILRKYWRSVWAVLFVSFWFAGLHVFQFAGDWIALPVILVMSLTWTIMRLACNSLVPCILCYFSYNATLMIVGWIGFYLRQSHAS